MKWRARVNKQLDVSHDGIDYLLIVTGRVTCSGKTPSGPYDLSEVDYDEAFVNTNTDCLALDFMKIPKWLNEIFMEHIGSTLQELAPHLDWQTIEGDEW